MNIKLSPSWNNLLKEELSKLYFQNIQDFLDSEVRAGKTIYPKQDDTFVALNHTPLDQVKVVILGQDPYHGA